MGPAKHLLHCLPLKNRKVDTQAVYAFLLSSSFILRHAFSYVHEIGEQEPVTQLLGWVTGLGVLGWRYVVSGCTSWAHWSFPLDGEHPEAGMASLLCHPSTQHRTGPGKGHKYLLGHILGWTCSSGGGVRNKTQSLDAFLMFQHVP